MLPNFCKISREAGAKNRSFVMEALLKFMLGGILDAIEEGRISFDLKSASGPEQLLLDIHFILMGCEPFVTEEVANRATLIIKRVMDSCSDIVDIMHQPGWYDERVRYLLRVNYPMDLGLSKPTK